MNEQAFEEIWAVDFEFVADKGERPHPVCCVAWELKSGRRLRVWKDDLINMKEAPYRVDGDCLFVAFYASAELGCHLALGWPMPANVLDLYAEFRALNNGRVVPCGWGLIGALTFYDLDAMHGADKVAMRDLIMSGGPWTGSQVVAILDYCEEDVAALARLLRRMGSLIDLPRALLRGRYMKAVACIENVGVPIDVDTLQLLQDNWPAIQAGVVNKINSDFGVFEGNRFCYARFTSYLSENHIPWPRLPSGRLDLKDDTFRSMARSYPQLQPLREVRMCLSQLRLMDLAVGRDGRNRTLLSPFRSKTGRNQPSNSRFIFGPAVWLRGLIKPDKGRALAYVDWSHQEFGIAAALSADSAMLEAYRSGDPYLDFAIRVGAAPADATKYTHPGVRERYKQVVLATQYGMGASLLAIQCGCSELEARTLLIEHRRIFSTYWDWIDGVINHLNLHGKIWTVFGWPLHLGDVNPRTAQNFPMQANGAEMLRLACTYLVEAGIHVCAPVHDAVLVEGPSDDMDRWVEEVRILMARASRDVLKDLELRTDVQVYRYPNRYQDPRGRDMWCTVSGLLGENAAMAC